MTFYVGQKVASNYSATDDYRIAFSTVRFPIKDCVYTVSFVDGKNGCQVRELNNRGYTFNVRWFRPIDQRKTDISIFTEILDRVNGNKPRVREVEHQS